MESRVTPAFRKAFERLPDDVRERARAAYRTFASDPWHPGVRFKRVHPVLPLWSARVSRDYRAVGQRLGDAVVWFWIGTHAENPAGEGEANDRLLRAA